VSLGVQLTNTYVSYGAQFLEVSSDFTYNPSHLARYLKAKLGSPNNEGDRHQILLVDNEESENKEKADPTISS
jgi:hypothetical protein